METVVVPEKEKLQKQVIHVLKLLDRQIINIYLYGSREESTLQLLIVEFTIHKIQKVTSILHL